MTIELSSSPLARMAHIEAVQHYRKHGLMTLYENL
jgi:hypothetical protein